MAIICVIGMATKFGPSRTTSTRIMASDRGNMTLKVVPWPTTECTSIRPFSAATSSSALFMPMPRPDIAVTLAAVLKPGRQIRADLLFRGHRRNLVRRDDARAIAAADNLVGSMPRPSSITSIATPSPVDRPRMVR